VQQLRGLIRPEAAEDLKGDSDRKGDPSIWELVSLDLLLLHYLA